MITVSDLEIVLADHTDGLNQGDHGPPVQFRHGGELFEMLSPAQPVTGVVHRLVYFIPQQYNRRLRFVNLRCIQVLIVTLLILCNQTVNHIFVQHRLEPSGLLRLCLIVRYLRSVSGNQFFVCFFLVDAVQKFIH